MAKDKDKKQDWKRHPGGQKDFDAITLLFTAWLTQIICIQKIDSTRLMICKKLLYEVSSSGIIGYLKN